MAFTVGPDQFSFHNLLEKPLDQKVLQKNPLAASTVLSELCKRGDVTSVRKLLQAGVDVNGYDEGNYFPLYSAASHGQLKNLPPLLEFGADLEQKSRPEGFTAFHGAACYGHLPIVQALIDAGADVNATSHDGSTPAMMAAGAGHLDILRSLIDSGGDINVQERIQGNTILIHACARGKSDIIRLALENQANTNIRMEGNLNALDVACLHGQVQAVQILLAHNAAVHAPLHMASCNGGTEICQLLLDHGIDVDMENFEGFTPLMAASACKNPTGLKFLLDHGADPCRGNGVLVPIILASEAGSLECVRALVEGGAIINEQSTNGNYALRAADAAGHVELVAFLKAHGAIDYDKEQQELDQEIFVAAAANDPVYLQRLVDQGANVHQADEQGRTALLVAAEKGHSEAIAVLLDTGTNVEAALTATGETALMLAARNGHLEAVKHLVAAGADLNRRTRTTGDTAVTFAVAHSRIGVVGFLIEAGAAVGSEALFDAIRRGHEEMVERLACGGVELNRPDSTSGATPLIQAIQDGNVNLVELLLMAGASPNSQSAQGSTPLTEAAGLGRPDVIAALISAGAEAQFDREALVRASWAGHVQIVQQLLHAGARADTKALVKAAEEGHIEVVLALLAAGADPYRETKHGITAVGQAVVRGHLDLSRILQQFRHSDDTSRIGRTEKPKKNH